MVLRLLPLSLLVQSSSVIFVRILNFHYDDGPSSVYHLSPSVLSVMLIVLGVDMNIHVLLRARMQVLTVLIFSFLLFVFQSLILVPILVPHVPNFVVLSSYVLYLLGVLQQKVIVALVYSHN